MKRPIVKRYEGNPILTPADIPYPVETVHNAGVTKYRGRYVMLFRSHRDNGRSLIGLAESEDGFRFVARPEPFLVPPSEGVFAEYERFGVEDARICRIDDEFPPEEAFFRFDVFDLRGFWSDHAHPSPSGREIGSRSVLRRGRPPG